MGNLQDVCHREEGILFEGGNAKAGGHGVYYMGKSAVEISVAVLSMLVGEE